MGIPFTRGMGFLLTATTGKLFTMTMGIQLTISIGRHYGRITAYRRPENKAALGFEEGFNSTI